MIEQCIRRSTNVNVKPGHGFASSIASWLEDVCNGEAVPFAAYGERDPYSGRDFKRRGSGTEDLLITVLVGAHSASFLCLQSAHAIYLQRMVNLGVLANGDRIRSRL